MLLIAIFKNGYIRYFTQPNQTRTSIKCAQNIIERLSAVAASQGNIKEGNVLYIVYYNDKCPPNIGVKLIAL